jgi:hypothetical protein
MKGPLTRVVVFGTVASARRPYLFSARRRAEFVGKIKTNKNRAATLAILT